MMWFIHPSLQVIQHQLLNLEWNYRRLVIRKDVQTGASILDFIWVNEDAQKLYDYLIGIIAHELAAARKREAEIYGLHPGIPTRLLNVTSPSLYNCNPAALDD